MGRFIRHLSEEHVHISKAIDSLDLYRMDLLAERTPPRARLDSSLTLLKTLVEKIHHRKEEELLFDSLLSLGLLPGGPRCSYFMGAYLNGSPAEKLLSSAGRHAQIEERFRHSVLSIPLEEHDASHFAFAKVCEAASLDEGAPGRSEALLSWIASYVSLMRPHIEKEETCLFVMADRLLDDATQDRLLARACEIEREEGFHV
jgi:hemerythrin-like domain-containing protein